MISSSVNEIVDIDLEWPKIYEKVKDADWFNEVATFYYEIAGKLKVKWHEQSISKAWEYPQDGDEDTKQLNATTPADAKWWIIPHHCTIVNGLFLYLVLRNSMINVKIYDSPGIFSGHVFLKDDNGRIYDLYWQPLGYSNLEVNQKKYTDGSYIDSITFWDKYDILYHLPSSFFKKE